MFGTEAAPEERWLHLLVRDWCRHLILVAAASLHMTFDTSMTPSSDDDDDEAASSVLRCQRLQIAALPGYMHPAEIYHTEVG